MTGRLGRATSALTLGFLVGALSWLGADLYLSLSGNARDRASIHRVEADLRDLKELARVLTNTRATPGARAVEDQLARTRLQRYGSSDRAVYTRPGRLLRGHAVLRASVVYNSEKQSWRATVLFAKHKYGSDAVKDAGADRGAQ